MKKLGVEIFAVGVDDGAVKTELNKIASRPLAGHVLTANYAELEFLPSLLAEKICQGKLYNFEFYSSQVFFNVRC